MHTEAGNCLDHLLYLRRRDQPRALEMSGRILMARTPEEILVVEPVPRIVPATVAGVPVDHPIRGCELVGRMCESADQHHRTTRRPGEPRQTGGEAHE